MKKRGLLILLALALVALPLFAACAKPAPAPAPAPTPAPAPAPAPAPPAEKIVIKAVTAFPKTHPNNDPVPIYIERVNKACEGELEIDWLGGPEVNGSFDQPDAVRTGTVDMLLYMPFGYTTALMPEAEAKGLSVLASWEERESGAYDLWVEIIGKRLNAYYLGMYHTLIPFNVFCNPKIEKIEDFNGLTIRVMPLYIPFMEALGVAPQTIPSSEMYTAVERGVVDGFMWPQWGPTGFAMQEVTKYRIDPGVFNIEQMACVNLDVWNKIPEHLQSIMIEEFKVMEGIGTARAYLDMEREWGVMEAAGMSILTLPPDDAKKFYDLAFESTWAYVLESAPEYALKLKELSSLKARPPVYATK